MKCPVCKTECHELSACPECGFKQLNPEFINRADMKNWMQNVVWPHRERYWKRLLPLFRIKNRKLLGVSLDYWWMQYPDATEITLSIPYGVEAIAIDYFQRLRPIDKSPTSGKRCPKLRSIYIPKTVSAINPESFDSTVPIDVDPSSPYYFVCDGHLIDKRTSALVIGPHPLFHTKLPACITRLAQDSCVLSEQCETYVRIPNTISAIDASALKICSTLCCVHIPKSVRFVERDGVLVICFDGKEKTKRNIHIFCDHDARPDTWDKEWIFQLDDSNNKAYVFWQGTWHYENGKPVPNDEAYGELVPQECPF